MVFLNHSPNSRNFLKSLLMKFTKPSANSLKKFFLAPSGRFIAETGDEIFGTETAFVTALIVLDAESAALPYIPGTGL